jgi:hypothetical protein
MEMPHYFYLSYARANHGDLVQVFFRDLEGTIRDELNLSDNGPLGFHEKTTYPPASKWSDAAAEALRTSLTMVCLFSPAYFRSDRVGKEWQVFKKRRRLYIAPPELRAKAPEILAHVILPVIWDQYSGPVPYIVSEICAHPEHVYQSRSIKEMHGTSKLCTGEYTEFVKSLASQILETTAEIRLPSLPEPLEMSKVQSAFQLWDQIVITSEGSRRESQQHKADCSEEDFVRDEQVNGPLRNTDVDTGVSPGSHSQPVLVSAEQTRTKPYSVFVVGNKNDEVLKDIKQCLVLNRDFKLDVYEDPELAKDRIDMLVDVGQDLPDLAIINLDMDGKVEELIEKSDDNGLRLLGFREPIRNDGSIALTPALKKYNKKRLLFTQMVKILEDKRKSDAGISPEKRPVFLSYCTADLDVAMGLRRFLRIEDIDLRFSPEIQAGENWPENLRDWLADAQVFLPLITNDYCNSDWCQRELTVFSLRDRREIIPVCYNLSNHDHGLFKEFIAETQCFPMSLEDFRKKVGILVKRIRDALMKQSKTGLQD